MKSLLFLVALVAVAYASTVSEEELTSHWENFKATHGKTYENSVEEVHRKKIFKENLIRINKHNAQYERGEKTFKVKVNKFADMLTHEIAEKMNNYKMSNASRSGVWHKPSMPVGSVKQVDWRKHGYVTPVKDQRDCGSCWSFSTTGALEGQLFKKTGKLVSLSEQNLIDCMPTMSCNSGGLMDDAFTFIKTNGGINTEASYPYIDGDEACKYNAEDSVGTDTGYVDIKQSESALQAASAEVGPISIAIDASAWSFNYYDSGVYYEEDCSSENLDHGVLLVGYGTTWLNKDYWIVKNSWGPNWGESGYIRMARNKQNNCGVATMASYPTVD